jgi:hypothetical protein
MNDGNKKSPVDGLFLFGEMLSSNRVEYFECCISECLHKAPFGFKYRNMTPGGRYIIEKYDASLGVLFS